jgi:hypothetical protein
MILYFGGPYIYIVSLCVLEFFKVKVYECFAFKKKLYSRRIPNLKLRRFDIIVDMSYGHEK